MPHKDPERRAEYQRDWARAFRAKNPERHQANVKRWIEANPKEAAEIASRKKTPEQRVVINARRRKRMRDDPSFRIRMSVSKQMQRALVAKSAKGWQALVGYTAVDLRAHLEAQFEWWMDWENYGALWEIDHIRPVSSFVLPDELLECWALSNLRPLQKEVNRSRENK